jgi:hypothetical protein
MVGLAAATLGLLLVISSCSGARSSIVVGCDSSGACHVALDRQQTRNLRDATSIATTLTLMCEKVNKTGLCQALGVVSAVTALQVARIFEDGNCFGLDFAPAVPNAVAVREIDFGTGNCA